MNELELVKAEDIVYKLIEGMPQSSTLEAVKKGLGQVFRSVVTTMHASSRSHSRPQTSNKILQQYIQRFTDLIIQETGTGATVVICQGRVGLFIKHLFNKEILKASGWS